METIELSPVPDRDSGLERESFSNSGTRQPPDRTGG